jgi:hypothetical protein
MIAVSDVDSADYSGRKDEFSAARDSANYEGCRRGYVCLRESSGFVCVPIIPSFQHFMAGTKRGPEYQHAQILADAYIYIQAHI